MKLINVLLKISGKENFKIDSRISKSYILRIIRRYGLMMIRGRIFSIGKNNISSNIFIGKNVKIYEYKNIKIGEKTKIHDNTKIDALSKKGVIIGENVVLGKNTIIECTGTIQSIGEGIKLGNNTSFGNDCFFGCAGGIEIGDDVIGGQLVRFHSENHNYKSHDKLIREQGVYHQGIKIGNNCWIGSGVVFLDGAILGDGCVVAANSVVIKKIPNNSVIGGIPAKIIKER